MARDLTLYIDRVSANGKKLQRWQQIPAHSSSYTPVDAPEWGEDPDIVGGSTYRKAPRLSVRKASGGGTSYPDFAVGMPTRAERKLLINLSAFLDSGDADHASFHTWMTAVTSPVVSLTTVPLGPQINLGAQWILLEGNPGDNIADFDVIFHGVHLPSTKRPLELKSKVSATMEITLVDITQHILRSIEPEWVARRHADVVGTTSNSCYEVWFSLYLTATRLWGAVGKPVNNEIGSGRFRISMVTYKDAMITLQAIANEIYQRLTRQTYNAATHSFALRSSSSSDQIADAGVPLDRVDLRQQDYTTTGASGGGISSDNRRFIAYVTDKDESDAVVAGRFSDGDGSIYGYETAWKWLDAELKGVGARGVIKPISTSKTELWLLGPAESVITHDIVRRDITEIKACVGGEYALRKVSMERPYYGEYDSATVEVLGDSMAAGTWSEKCAFEVGGINGSKDAWQSKVITTVPGTYFSGRTPFVVQGLPIGMYDLVYYKVNTNDILAGGTADIYVSAHPHVGLYGAFGSSVTDYPYTPSSALPTPTVSGNATYTSEHLLRYLRPEYIRAQQQGGLGTAVAKDILARYGQADAHRLEISVRAESLPESASGARLRLTPGVDDGGGGTEYIGQMLLDRAGDSSADHVPGIGEITELVPEGNNLQIVAFMNRKT